MSSHKPDKDSADSEFNDHDKSVIIPFYIEYIMLITNIIG